MQFPTYHPVIKVPMGQSTYEITIGMPNRNYQVVYLVPAHNADYALAAAESRAIEDGLLGRYGFGTPDRTVSYCHLL